MMSTRRPSTTTQTWQEQKAIAIQITIESEHDRYLETKHPRHAARAYQIARKTRVSIPEWVLRHFDTVASELTRETARTKTDDRYFAALAQMQAAVESHQRRLVRRQVAQRLNVPTPPVSRRDRPNLSAIARQAARDYHVSLNRLLARYRRSR